MTMIMVSYRRVDQEDMAGRIADFLMRKYGEDSVFFDVDSIPAGAEYLDLIRTTIAGCDAVVAVIGPHWLRKVADDNSSRPGNPTDYVKIEIETAREYRKPIFPVLVNEVTMPAPSDLPETLRFLSAYNAARVTSEDFRYHMTRLTTSIDSKLGLTGSRLLPPLRRFWMYAVGAAAAGLAIVVWSVGPSFERPLAKTKTSDGLFAAITTGTATTGTAPADNTPLAVPASVTARAKAQGGFIFPDSDRRYLSEADLAGLSAVELRVARNEIFARHGRFFKDQTLANYFSQFSWYQPGAVEVTISQLEATNVDAIKLAEHQR
jgi:YARHG domain/TIR domain